ncbi:MAG TPA: hypothetical protein VF139_11605 [Candidatus Polarisedimenticolaceae bacterium]
MTALASLALIALTSTHAAAQERSTMDAGLDVALRLEGASGPPERRALTRIRPTLTIRPADGWTLVAQGQLYGASESDTPRSADLYQGFAQLARERFELRLGRQELVLGSGFLLGADERFDGAAYDAIHAIVRPRPGLAVAAFCGRSVSALSPEPGGIVAGVVVGVAREGKGVEAYAIDDGGAATSLGARAVARRGALAVEVEPVFQSGGAWGGHVELTYALERGAFRPRLTLGHAVASPAFLHPRHDTSQVGDMGVIPDLSGFAAGASVARGLRATSLAAEIPLGSRAGLSLTLRRFGAAEVTGASSRDVGREIDAVATVRLSDALEVAVSVDRFDGGDFQREATGEGLRVRYGFAALRCRF